MGILTNSRSFLRNIRSWKKEILIFTILLSIVANFSPLFPIFFESGKFSTNSFAGTHLADAIRSDLVRLAHACNIAASLPMIMDIFLDFIEGANEVNLTDKLVERVAFLLALIIPSIIYIPCRELDFAPVLFVTLIGTQCCTVAALIWNEVLPQVYAKSPHILPPMTYLLVVMYVVRTVLRMCDVLYTFGDALQLAVQVLTCCLFAGSVMLWAYYLWRTIEKKSVANRSFSSAELTCMLYLTVLVVYFICILIVGRNVHMTNSWKDTCESDLITYCFFQIIVSVIVSGVLGRIVRGKATKSMDLLTLKRAFVRYVSHEIRSPLNVVHSGIDFLLDQIRQNTWSLESIVEMLEDIFSSSESAIYILNDLLEYEKLDAGTFKLDQSWVLANRLLSPSKLKWADFMAKRKGIRFSIEDCMSLHDSTDSGAGNNVLSYADEGKLMQVIRNLLTNAFKFTARNGSVTLKLSISRRKRDSDHHHSNKYLLSNDSMTEIAKQFSKVEDLLLVEVIDNGAGIAKEDHSKVFREFSQFDRNNLQGGGGSGLGLWISRQIVALHNGNLNFFSEGKDKGSTFFFELPLYCSKVSGLITDSGTITGPAAAVEVESNTMEVTYIDANNFGDVESGTNPWRASQTLLSLPSSSSRSHVPFSTELSARSSRREQHPMQGLLEPPLPPICQKVGDGRVDTTNSSPEQEHKASTQRDSRMFIKVKPTAHPVSDGDCDAPVSLRISQKSPQSTTTTVGKTDDVARLPSCPRESHSSSDFENINALSNCLASESASSGRDLRFLIVDDSELNRKMVVKMLRSEYKRALFMEADDGEVAVELLKKEMNGEGSGFDFVLMDNIMIKMNGPDAAKIMRKELKFTGVILGITGNVHPEQIAEFEQHGADAVISKPLTKAKLLAALSSP